MAWSLALRLYHHHFDSESAGSPMKNQEQPMEMVRLLLLNHQSAVQPIGPAGTLEEFGLVENMQPLDILLLLLS
jgi:hypothetical protein